MNCLRFPFDDHSKCKHFFCFLSNVYGFACVSGHWHFADRQATDNRYPQINCVAPLFGSSCKQKHSCNPNEILCDSDSNQIDRFFSRFRIFARAADTLTCLQIDKLLQLIDFAPKKLVIGKHFAHINFAKRTERREGKHESKERIVPIHKCQS